LLGHGSWGFWRWRRRRRVDLSGRWSARIGARGAPSSRDGELVVLELHQAGRKLALASSAVNIERDPDWQNYRDFWRQRNGTELRRVFYRGEGKVLGDDDEDADADTASAPTRSTAPPPKLVIARRIVVAVRIFAAGSESEPIDGGTLNGTVDVDDQRIHGQLWLESEQAERAVDLKRGT
jgi:hypothetical protein